MEMTREKKDIKERQWRRSTQVSGVSPGAKGTNGSEVMFTDSQRLSTHLLRGQADGSLGMAERRGNLPSLCFRELVVTHCCDGTCIIVEQWTLM